MHWWCLSHRICVLGLWPMRLLGPFVEGIQTEKSGRRFLVVSLLSLQLLQNTSKFFLKCRDRCVGIALGGGGHPLKTAMLKLHCGYCNCCLVPTSALVAFFKEFLVSPCLLPQFPQLSTSNQGFRQSVSLSL